MPEVKNQRRERAERGINEKRTVSKLIEMNLPTGIRRCHTYTNITISSCLFFISCWKCVPLPSFIVIFKKNIITFLLQVMIILLFQCWNAVIEFI